MLFGCIRLCWFVVGVGLCLVLFVSVLWLRLRCLLCLWLLCWLVFCVFVSCMIWFGWLWLVVLLFGVCGCG